MALLTIADLDQPAAVINGYLEQVHELGAMYREHIRNTQDDTVEYTVKIEGGKARAPGIHASEISNCLRQVVLNIRDVPKKANVQTADPNMLMRFRLGHAVHALLQNDWHDIAKRSNGRITFEDEVRLSPEHQEIAAMWNIHSSCDGIITLWSDPDDQGVRTPLIRVGLEIKTKSDKMYSKMTRPETEHMEQTTIYQAVLDLPLMWVLYYNKSDCNYSDSRAPNLFKFNANMWENDLQMRFVVAHDHAEKGEMGPPTEGFHCKWCPWAHVCNPKILQRGATRAPLPPSARRALTKRLPVTR